MQVWVVDDATQTILAAVSLASGPSGCTSTVWSAAPERSDSPAVSLPPFRAPERCLTHRYPLVRGRARARRTLADAMTDLMGGEREAGPDYGPVYLDHAATTPMLPVAIEAMTRHLGETGNPSSLHASGRRARRVVEEARETIAQALDCRPGDVVFTSGRDRVGQPGAEGDLLGAAGRRPEAGPGAGERDRAPRRPRPADVARGGGGGRGRAPPRGRAGPAACGRAAREHRARPRERGPGVGDVGQQRGGHAPADRRGGGPRGAVRHPRAHRRDPGGRGGPGRLRRERGRPDDADRAQDRWTVRRRGAASCAASSRSPR